MSSYKCGKCIYEEACDQAKYDDYFGECKLYKDKSLFVEVVRCNDCIYYGGITYGFVCKIFSGNETKICMNSDDYCSYAERKLKEVGE